MEALTGEVLDIHNEYRSYGDYKAALDGELQRSAESFVRIGYLLKVAADTDILKESGYRSVYDFAQEEYNLDKSQVSRFIRINDEFSENGYSDKLQERYRNFGHAKLAIMLLLPAEINEELTASYTKAEIQALKDEVAEERKVTDLEVMIEDRDERQQDFGILGKVLHQIGRDDPDMYLKMKDAVCDTAYDGTIRPVVDKLMDALAPSGEAIISARIAGEGRKMLSIKGADIDPVVVSVRSGEKLSCSWDQLIDEMEALCPDAEDGRKAWEILYGEPFPEKKEKVAPVQPQKKKEEHKTGRVTKAKQPKDTKAETIPGESEGEQQEAGRNLEEGQKQEGQEAAGVEDKESGESKTQGENGADSAVDREHETDLKPSHDEDGAGGGSGSGSATGGADCEGSAGVAPVQPEDEQIEGQASITDYPEYMPDNRGESAQTADMENPETVITDLDGRRQHIENQKKQMAKTLQSMIQFCSEENWDKLVELSQEIITRAESIKNMVEVWNG